MIAAFHHDIGMWSAHRVDYRPPSIREVISHLGVNRLSPWVEEIKLLIDLPHQILAIAGEVAEEYPLREVFRWADLADFSLGLIFGRVPRDYFQKVKRQFPTWFSQDADEGSRRMVSQSPAITTTFHEVVTLDSESAEHIFERMTVQPCGDATTRLKDPYR